MATKATAKRSTKPTKPFVHYMHPGAWPVHIGFTTSEERFSKEVERLGVAKPIAWVNHGADATTHVLTNNGGRTIIVCLDTSKKVSKAQILGLICHESCHVWNEVCDAMRGQCPGGEHQAYGVQWIAQCFAEQVWGDK